MIHLACMSDLIRALHTLAQLAAYEGQRRTMHDQNGVLRGARELGICRMGMCLVIDNERKDEVRWEQNYPSMTRSETVNTAFTACYESAYLEQAVPRSRAEGNTIPADPHTADTVVVP